MEANSVDSSISYCCHLSELGLRLCMSEIYARRNLGLEA